MRSAMFILLTLVTLTTLTAQKRIVKPEMDKAEETDTRLFPDQRVPFPSDSLQLEEAIRFYERKIENLDGSEDPDKQARILYCIAELNRLNRKYNQAVFSLIDANRSLNRDLDTLDRSLLLSRFCFNMLALKQEDRGYDFPRGLIRELGFSSFESLMLNTLDMMTALGDEQNTLAILHVAFEYYQITGRSATAYLYGEQLLDYKDHVAGAQLKRKRASLEDLYEMKQRASEIQLLNNQRILNQEMIRGSDRQLWIIIISVGLLLIFAFALLRRVRTIRKTRDLLQESAARLQHEKERARRNEVFKEQFLANVSHEIRTPMNAIMGITNILINDKHLKSQEKYLLAMQESAKNLLTLINDILDLSKLEAGKMELVQTPFNLRQILDELYAKLKGKARDKGLSLQMEVNDDVPEILTGDGYVLSNILMNLVMNAISFTIRGSVEIICRAGHSVDGRVHLLFEVRDTGMGIVPEKQEKILNTFVKVYDKSSVQYEGSGLELAIINQLVELQGGSIRLESTPNVGTTFFVEIPYLISADAVVEEPAAVKMEDCELRDVRILLVEDNEFNVMVATTVLESVISGLTLDVAENGKIALDKLAEKEYSLILMDVQMPVMDGYETTRRIRKLNGPVGGIPIIAMTANVLQQEVDKCLKEGMDDYISKPFDTMALLGKMKKLLIPVS